MAIRCENSLMKIFIGQSRGVIGQSRGFISQNHVFIGQTTAFIAQMRLTTKLT
jgi:hypothetical protein